MTTAKEQIPEDVRPDALIVGSTPRRLSWMASMSAVSGDIRAAESYLLELMSWCAFSDRK